MNRNLLCMCLLSVALLVSCERFAPEERIVVSPNGMHIRESSSRDARSLGVIPFREKVAVLQTGTATQKIDGVEGHWAKVRWNDITGWVFDAYLKKEHGDKCPVYSLRETICYDNDKLQAILKKRFPGINMYQPENYEKYQSIDLRITDFTDIPNIIPGDTLLAVDRNGVVEQKVDALRSINSPMYGTYLEFSTKRIGQNIPAHSPRLYFKAADYRRISDTLPEVYTLRKIETSESLMNLLPQTYADFRKFYFMDRPVKNPKQDLYNMFHVAFLQSDKFPWLVFAHFSDKGNNGYYNYIAIFIKNKLVYIDNAEVHFLTVINDKLYLEVTHWTPHTDDSGDIMYRITSDSVRPIELYHDFK